MTVRANGRERHNRLERGERAQPRSRRSHPRLLPAGSGGSSEWWQRRRRFCHPTYRFQQESWSRSRARVRTAHGSATLRTRAISSFFSLTVKRALSRVSSRPRSHGIRLASPRSFRRSYPRSSATRVLRTRQGSDRLPPRGGAFFSNGPLSKEERKEGRKKGSLENFALFRKNDRGKVDNR